MESEGSRLESLDFSNRCLKELPIDKNARNYIRIVKDSCFTHVLPTALENPRIVSVSEPALNLIGLGKAETELSEFTKVFSGNSLIKGSSPFAHCYCGHQFGSFAGQLGDGAAIYLGEIRTKEGNYLEIQLKGAGKTPFSRTADGRKVLRSSMREFLCSEHMNSLNIPTTRAATLIVSDTTVIRDLFYDGNEKKENCAVVCRIAPSFLRFGSFEITKAPLENDPTAPSAGKSDILKQIANFVIQMYFPHLLTDNDTHPQPLYSSPVYNSTINLPDTQSQSLPLKSSSTATANIEVDSYPEHVYKAFYKEVIHNTAKLVAHWQAYGWCHGVLNTDNLSILGITIDYGPFGFMEHYDPDYIPNTTDQFGRYKFVSQPMICKWNCMKLGEVLSPLIKQNDLKEALEDFIPCYENIYYQLMKQKLGIINQWKDSDIELLNSLLKLMQETGSDWTNTFRDFNLIKIELFESYNIHNTTFINSCTENTQSAILKSLASIDQLIQLNKSFVNYSALPFYKLLSQTQPTILESLGITTETINMWEMKMRRLQNLIETTDEQHEQRSKEKWQSWLHTYCLRLWEDFSETPDCDIQKYAELHRSYMNKINPKIILRNHMAQKAIEDANNGDYGEVNRLLGALMRPYDEDHRMEDCIPLGGKHGSLNILS